MTVSESAADRVTATLTAPALPESLEEVHELVAALWSAVVPVVSAKDRIRFESAVIEIVGNVIEHALPQEDADGVTVQIVLRSTPEALVADITDDAQEARIPSTDHGMPADDVEHGRGLALVRSMCDELEHRRDVGLNRWTLLCRRD